MGVPWQSLIIERFELVQVLPIHKLDMIGFDVQLYS